MKKVWVFFRLYWTKMLIVIVIIALMIGAGFFFNYCFQNFMALESFSKRQISAQMALMMPMFVIVHLISLPIMVFMQYYFIQGGFAKLGQGNISMAKADVKWEDVIGMEAAKIEAWEMVKLLKDRHLVKAIGGKIIKGTMMLGPPGCGKTYLAKAIAGECGLPFLPIVGSDFVCIFVGQGAERMKSLFKQARALADLHGGCIIFIDEIDSFARHRTGETPGGGGGVVSHNATINQFLTELDGLRKKENNIVVIAATNAAESELDSAIMRSGRFDRKIYVGRPNLKERELLFNFYLKKVKAEMGIDTKLLARKALYFTPADIDGMIREAGIISLRDKRKLVTIKDLSEAYDRVIFGMKSNIILSEEERMWTAYHEAGHAIIAYLCHPTDDVIKASIIPHKGFLGMVSSRPSEEQHSSIKEHLIGDIKMSVASYVAEELKFGSTSTGVGGGPGSDFYTAICIARRMVWSYGMGKSGLIGDFTAQDSYYEMRISEKTKETLDNDIQDILQTCLKDVREILTKHMDLLEKFSQDLLKKGELEYDEIVKIFNSFGLKSPRKIPKI